MFLSLLHIIQSLDIPFLLWSHGPPDAEDYGAVKVHSTGEYFVAHSNIPPAVHHRLVSSLSFLE